MFKNAKSINTATTTTKKSKKEEVTLEGLQDLATIDALIDSLSAMKKSLEGAVKAQAFNHFIDVARVTHKRDSYRGVDGDASASVELRKRSTTSVLKDEEKASLDVAGIEYETLVKTPKLYAINPAHASNEVLMLKVEKAIEAALIGTGIDDLIVVQDEVKTFVVDEKTIDAVFAMNTIDPHLVQLVTTQALKCKVENFDVAAALEFVKNIVAPVEEIVEEVVEEKVA